MDIKDCFKVGYVAGTHGLKGEITMVLQETTSENLESIWLQIKGELVPYFIERLSDRGDKAFVKLEGVDTPEQAHSLKGTSIYLSKDLRPELERSEFYDDEVIGFAVVDEKTGHLGRVIGVEIMGPNRLLSVGEGKKNILIPVNGPFIKSLNRSKKRFTVDLPDGFLDI
jgi:16S rRNA processing protein RimM